MSFLAALCALALMTVGCSSDSDDSSGNDGSGNDGSGATADGAGTDGTAPGTGTPAGGDDGSDPAASGADTGTSGDGAGSGSGDTAGSDATGGGAAGASGGTVDPGADPRLAMVDATDGFCSRIEAELDAELGPEVSGCRCTGLDTGFPGDDKCLLPPPPEEGMQIHIGPESYEDGNPELEAFRFPPGSETSQCWNFHTPNDEKIWYQGAVLSGRDGTHHIINTMYQTDLQDGLAGGGFQVCRDGGTGTNADSIGNLPGASRPYMPMRPAAPENANLGRSIPPNTPSQADMHYFNFGDGDLLREFWLNVYYIPEEEVEEQANQIRGMGGLSWFNFPLPGYSPIQPGTDEVYEYSCPINQDGRIINLLGHYHSHGREFQAWIERDGERTKVFQMYDYLEPAIFSYDSVTENPGFSEGSAGATSGMLEVQAGDRLVWSCHIVNDSDVPLTYTNEVETGEMCNIWGASVGTTIDCVVQ
ncbi:MAG: hypothetical protein PVI30_10000 [Myxococcales bacterium]|jgi:hypothetical protein